MKKLALAPAVAIAITGLAASPVIAAPEAPASAASSDSQTTTAPGVLKARAGSIETHAEKEPVVTLSAEKLSQADFGDEDKGVDVNGLGLKADHGYDIIVSPQSGQNVNKLTTTATTDSEGTFSHKIYGADDTAYVGTYSVTVNDTKDSNISYQMTFEVTGDESDEPEAPAADPKISVADQELTAEELQKDGIKVEGEGFTPDGEVLLVGGTAQSPFGTATVKADENGKVSGTVKSETALEPGEYSVWGADQEADTTSEPVKVTVVEEETEEPTTPAAEAELTVSPKTVSPADFIDKDKGVTLAVENCEPGEDVEFVVNPKGDSNVTAYENTTKADDEGKASVNVYGTSSDASAYIGDYDVTVTCGDAELTGEFSVSDDANAGGSDGDEDGNDGADDKGNEGDADGADNGNGGGDLPRTGTELTGLVGGAGLLLIGGISVALTMRRKKAAQDPSEI
ncbi:LPXTG cell wall anchor domain-containing protein [Brevibacterium renqingii]|uniref:LPXTG cell wall anchor domain-containing protein n=1 Tax=Brevibacterium renqingii TaxID=2776916 RepID=UPI001ADF64D2|nr:LPXTG cell wall anchor domain-containing protein [Brevibacterium renqingii]